MSKTVQLTELSAVDVRSGICITNANYLNCVVWKKKNEREGRKKKAVVEAGGS